MFSDVVQECVDFIAKWYINDYKGVIFLELLREFYAGGNCAVFLVKDKYKKLVANLMVKDGVITIDLQETFEKGSLFHDVVHDFVYDTFYKLEKVQKITYEFERIRKLN